MAFWQSQRNTLYDLYWNQGLSSTKIASIYNVYPETITYWMRRLEIPRRIIGSDQRPNAKYSVDSFFFDDINSEEKAYILGFILSDGHVSKRNHIMFTVGYADKDILYSIRDALHSTHPIKEKLIKNSNQGYNSTHAVCLDICSKRLCDSLHNIGIYNDKTFSLDIDSVLNFVPPQFETAFIRGLFDGDGSICIYKYEYFTNHTYHVGFTGLKKTCDYIQAKFKLSTKMQDEGNGIYTVRSTCKNDIVRIGHFMYDDATIFMKRKKETFDRVYALVESE